MSWVNGKSSLLSLVMNSEGVETRMVVERRLQVCGRVFPPKFFFWLYMELVLMQQTANNILLFSFSACGK